MLDHKPVNAACLRNQEPISEVLATEFVDCESVLELGSGTGQHAVYIAGKLPNLIWQPTELEENIAGINAWVDYAGLANVKRPKRLDVNEGDWSLDQTYDAIFTANVIHFVGWSVVTSLLSGAAQALKPGGILYVYGPFNDRGRYTSDGNAQLDEWLKKRDPDSGIKDLETVISEADSKGLIHSKTLKMPANNLMVRFDKA